MNRHTRTGALALLAVILFVALGAMVLNRSADPSALPDPIDVALDFDQLVPGEPQVETYPFDVPGHARVAEAGIVQATGIADDIAWTFELCQSGRCAPIATGQQLESGSYTLQVSAVLQTDAGGTGQVAGGVSFEQATTDPTLTWTPIHTLITVALGAIAVGALLSTTTLRRQGTT